MCSNVEDYESLESVFSIHYLGNDTPLIDHQNIAKHTVKDSLLCKVMLLVKEGWKENDCKIDSIEPYFNQKYEISIDEECLLWRSRVIIPEKLNRTEPPIFACRTEPNRTIPNFCAYDLVQ